MWTLVLLLPGGVGTHISFPFILDKQEDFIQLIQLGLGVIGWDADWDYHYILQHCKENRHACVSVGKDNDHLDCLDKPVCSLQWSTRPVSHILNMTSAYRWDVVILSVQRSRISQVNSSLPNKDSPVLRGLKCRMYGSLTKASRSSVWLSSYW